MSRALGLSVGQVTAVALMAICIPQSTVCAQTRAVTPPSFQAPPRELKGPQSSPLLQSAGPEAAPIDRQAGPQAGPLEPLGPRREPPTDPALERDLQILRSQAAAGGPAPARSDRRRSATSAVTARARDAAWLLGLLALNGVGMPRDPAAAQQWFERANALGKTLAASGLAWCRIEGCVSTPDPAAARRWTRQLRAVDAPRADYLDWLIDQRLAPLQLAPATPLAAAAPRDGLPPSQVQRLGRIAQAGSVAARAALALNDITAGRDSDALRVFESISRQSPAAAANASVLRARLSASQPIRSPAGSSAQAAEWLAEARRFHRGEGRPANYAEAIRLYRRAAAAGNLEAQRMLNLIATRIGPDGQLDIAGIQQLAWLKLDGTQVDGLTGPMIWQSDSTPLFDLLPPVWRQRAARS